MQTLGFSCGFRDGIPIGLGYLSVSFTFGMMAVAQGLPVWAATLTSMTNLTSAGQFAGLSLMVTGGGYIEMVLTQLVINLRYALMSLSLSQKLDKTVSLLDRFLFAFFNTDEIFAVASGKPCEVGKRYLFGLAVAPFWGWSIGTLLGAVAGNILPIPVRDALGIAIYGMFIAIIIPACKQYRPVLIVTLCACILSCLFAFLPVLNRVSSGFTIIICALVSAGLGALLFPVQEQERQAQ